MVRAGWAMIAALLLLTVLPPAPASGGAPAGTVDRLDGASRFDTALAIANRVAPGGGTTVHAARADDFIDALAAGTLRDGPIILVPSDGDVPGTILDQLATAPPATIVGIGGPAAVSDTVLAQLATAAGVDTPTRLAGTDRYATATAIARAAWPDGAQTVYLARADNPVDAVAGGALRDGPVVPVPTTGTIPDPIFDLLTSLAPDTVVALGGTAAVSATTLDTAAAVIDADTDRLAGDSRYATAAAIAEAAFPLGTNQVYLARGDVVADAVAAGALTDGPIVLVPPCGTLPEPVADAIDTLGASRATALGGNAAICDDLLDTVTDHLAPPPVLEDDTPNRYTTLLDESDAEEQIADYDPGTGIVTVTEDAAIPTVGSQYLTAPTETNPWGIAGTVRHTDGDQIYLDPPNLSAAFDHLDVDLNFDDLGPFLGVDDTIRRQDVDGNDLGPLPGYETPYDAVQAGAYEDPQFAGDISLDYDKLYQPINIPIQLAPGIPARITGGITFDPDGSINYADTILDIVDDATIDLAATAGASLNLAVSGSLPPGLENLRVEDGIRPLTKNAFILGIIPMYVQVYTVLMFTVSSDLTVGVDIAYSASASATIDSGNFSLSGATSNLDVTPRSSVEATYRGRVGIGIRAGLGRLIDTNTHIIRVGKGLHAEILGGGDASYGPHPDGSTEIPGTLDVGLVEGVVEWYAGVEGPAVTNRVTRRVSFPPSQGISERLAESRIFSTAPPAPITTVEQDPDGNVRIEWPQVPTSNAGYIISRGEPFAPTPADPQPCYDEDSLDNDVIATIDDPTTTTYTDTTPVDDPTNTAWCVQAITRIDNDPSDPTDDDQLLSQRSYPAQVLLPVVLRQDGIDLIAFGTEPEAAIESVSNALGAPDFDTGWEPYTGGPGCGNQQRRITWPGLAAYFGLGGPVEGFQAYGAFTPSYRTSTGIGVGSTLGELREAHPGVVVTPLSGEGIDESVARWSDTTAESTPNGELTASIDNDQPGPNDTLDSIRVDACLR